MIGAEAKKKLALVHAMRAELNRARYLEALGEATEQDEVLARLREATSALLPGAGPISYLQD